MIRIGKALLLAASMLFALGAPGVQANPDVWVKAGMTYRFEDGKISGITFDWRFDEYFSSRAIETYDGDRSRVLEATEVGRLRGEAFDPLGKSGYHVHVWEAGKKRENLGIEDFTASIDGNLLVYRFTVALTPPADPGAGRHRCQLVRQGNSYRFSLHREEFHSRPRGDDPGCKFRVARGKGAQADHRQPVTLKCGG